MIGKALLAITIALFLVLPAQAVFIWPTESVTFTLNGVTNTVNTQLGYVANSSSVGTLASVTHTDIGDSPIVPVRWGWVIEVLDYDGSSIAISYPVAGFVSRYVNGTGVQTNSSFIPDQTFLHVGYSCLKATLYVKVTDQDPVAKAIFVTPQLMEKRVNNTAWTFSLYTNFTQYYNATDVKHYRICTASWGDTAHASQFIVTFVKPEGTDLSMYEASRMNYVGFFLAPYLNLLGAWFYAISFLGFIIYPLWRRTGSINNVLFALIFMGSGGPLSLLLPSPVLALGWGFLIIGIAGMIIKLMKGAGYG